MADIRQDLRTVSILSARIKRELPSAFKGNDIGTVALLFSYDPMGEQFKAIEDRGGGSSDEGLIDKTWKYVFTYVFPFIVGLGSYVGGFFIRDLLRPLVLAIGLAPDLSSVPVTVKDIGYCFALLSGLLNILVMMDAYDVAFNAELFSGNVKDRREKWLQ